MSKISEFTHCTTKISDKDVLIDVLREMYGTASVEIHETAQPLNDYFGRQTGNKAHIIVRKQSGVYADLGFEQTGPNQPFILHIDTMNKGQGGLNERIQQNYSAAYLERALRNNRRFSNIRREVTRNRRNQVIIKVRAEHR